MTNGGHMRTFEEIQNLAYEQLDEQKKLDREHWEKSPTKEAILDDLAEQASKGFIEFTFHSTFKEYPFVRKYLKFFMEMGFQYTLCRSGDYVTLKWGRNE